MTKEWAATAAPPPLSPDEEAAFARMQSALQPHLSDPNHPIAKLVQKEGATPDFTTPEGRHARSARNLRILQQQHDDYPNTLRAELEQAMARTQCTALFAHDTDHTDSIIKQGQLLSNAQLLKNGIDPGGMTASCVINDEKMFGNTDFVFTSPQFHEPGAALTPRGGRLFVPAAKVVASEQAWLSFSDWADIASSSGKGQDKYTGSRRGAGNELPPEKSFVTDFYMGDDITKAMAVKTFEAMKAAIVLHPDPAQPEAFNREAALKFLDNLAIPGYRRGALGNHNTLEKPLSGYTLTEAQLKLLTGRSELRGTLLQKATAATLSTMAEYAELKIPNHLSLEGGAMPSFKSTGPDGAGVSIATHFVREGGTHGNLAFTSKSGQREIEIATVPADTRPQPQRRITQVG